MLWSIGMQNRCLTSMAAIKQTEVDSGKALDDTGITDLLFKQVKLRRESIADYERGGRTEQAAKEQAEVVIIEQYLPKMMSREEVTALVVAAIPATKHYQRQRNRQTNEPSHAPG